ncbi:MAG: outer membrane protein assembly factor BamD [Alphaproteobacteria bacterium TMED194]|nr:MAG: outer membrane protein assembly factor BamD [Alphaproteobacteria bacterium TMED194]|tara:strand:+ start:3911 stop:4696 length:786 start_codon:yes stop_codon:yes gene_type:complete
MLSNFLHIIHSFKTGLALFLLLLLLSCASNKSNENEYLERNLYQIYSNALNSLLSFDYEEASLEFEEVERQHPYSEWAKKAIIMSAYSSYKNKDYIKAEANLNRFLSLYPASDLAAYAQYLLGINYFDQIIEVSRDQTAVTNSLEVFKLILDRYPKSNYAKDAYFKIIFLENKLAAKEIYIGMTYLGLKKYVSALKRFKFVVNNYQTTNYTPEALHRLVEIYLILGVKEEALVNARVLGYNFPDSTWYKLSYNLLKKKKVF